MRPESYDCVYHVTATSNRESIKQHGLDWMRMGGAPGLASNELVPERAGIFVCRDIQEARWFARFAERRFSVDIWSIRSEGLMLEESEDGFLFCSRPIAPDRLELVDTVER